jgi:pseudouridine synthase
MPLPQPNDGIRINRYFTETGFMSRREADRAVEAGQVRINGQLARPGDRVGPGDRVTWKGKLIQTGHKTPVILAYHKPIGVECTSDPNIRSNIIDAVGYRERIFHVGRLDKMSEGLILLTNLGDIVNKILRAGGGNEKEYIVNLNGPISDEQLSRLRSGIVLDEGKTLPARVIRLTARTFKIILTEGKHRQIRRMVEDLGLEVTRLRRTRIMHIELGDLPKGQWRKLSPYETKTLMGAISN